MQDRFVTMWKKVASRYANESAIASFDVINEPTRGALTIAEFVEYLYPFYEKLISEIRESDPNHVIMYEKCASLRSLYESVRAQLNYSNIVFSFHFYCLKERYDGNRTRLEIVFDEYTSLLKDWNIPIFVGEFNTHADFPKATEWIRDVVELFNENQLSWTWWTYYKSNYQASLCYRNGTERVELTKYLKISA